MRIPSDRASRLYFFFEKSYDLSYFTYLSGG